MSFRFGLYSMISDSEWYLFGWIVQSLQLLAGSRVSSESYESCCRSQWSQSAVEYCLVVRTSLTTPQHWLCLISYVFLSCCCLPLERSLFRPCFFFPWSFKLDLTNSMSDCLNCLWYLDHLVQVIECFWIFSVVGFTGLLYSRLNWFA